MAAVVPGKWLIFWWGCILAKRSGLTWLSVQQRSKVRLVNGSVCRNHLFFLATCLTTAYCVSAWGWAYRWRWWQVCSFCLPIAPCRQGYVCFRWRSHRKTLRASPSQKLANNLNNIIKQITLLHQAHTFIPALLLTSPLWGWTWLLWMGFWLVIRK